MEHFVSLLFFLIAVLAALTLPMSTPSGDADMTSFTKHMLLMQQTISGLQIQVQTTTGQLSAVTNRLQTVEDELRNVVSELRVAETDIEILKHDLQNCSHIDDIDRLEATIQDLKVSQSAMEQNVSQVTNVTTSVKSTITTVNRIDNRVSVAEAAISTVQSKQNKTEQELSANKALVQSTSTEMKVVKSEVNTISRHVNGVSQVLSAFQTKSESDNISIRGKQNKIEVAMAKLNSSVLTTSIDLNVYKAKLSEITNGKTGKEVAFQISQRQGNSSGWTTLKFDRVNSNIGGGYNKTSGLFTAPTSGTYIFWVNVVVTRPIGEHAIFIYGDKQHPIRGYCQINDSDDSCGVSTMTVTHLDAGNHVHFTMANTRSGVRGDGWSSYGGALLHATGM